jgi:hypothetical protein
MNIRLIAVQAGDALKYDTSVNEIERVGRAVFPFQRDEFPEESITSVRAKLIYDWLMSLGTHSSTSEERARLISMFLLNLTGKEDTKSALLRIIENGGVKGASADREILNRFDALLSRCF